ncbi:putative uncharacterized protein ENSP00000383309 [Cajanus cajan]|uniref:putative uncharacterized protein ENSP00000383309 n=1 Tax=Cajanus cajan TaxID=3821 RepID=UPI00098D8717|nr:putative uncharacterized protein ENSP00000383309 [Cajanus cajan]
MNRRNVNPHHHRRGHSFNGFANINLLSNTSSSNGKLSFESAKLVTSGIDDLLSSTEGGKHDYDWLLTPPGTPHLPSSKGEPKPALGPPRSSLGRPTSNTNASRLSVSPSENNNHNQPHSRSSRSGSVTRSPNRSFNTSPASVSSHIRPPSPITRSPSAARPSTPTRAVLPRSLPTDTTKTRTTSQGSRPSTPTSTRRHSPRPQPVVPPDFPLETPPNLRTTLPADRPVSAGRSRPGAVVTLPLKPNSETRIQPSPIVNRGRLSEYTAKGRCHTNASQVVAQKSLKSSTTATDSNGLGRTISKKSLDMAIRHMDVRNSSRTLGSLSSATLYPQSIRTSTPKTQHTRGLSVPLSMNFNGSFQSRNIGNGSNRIKGRERDEKQNMAKLSDVDMYESYRYDSLLFKEDLNNTNWLRSVDDRCDQGPIFDNGFESLPEPFGLL